MSGRFEGLEWELRTSASLEELADFALLRRRYSQYGDLPEPYDLTDVSPFSPSSMSPR